MKLLPSPAPAAAPRRGAALMLSFMVLLILILILAQIRYSTATADRVARNEETLVAMDSAIESALLQVFEDLKTDGASGAGAAAGGGLGGGGGDTGADPAAGGEDSGPTDSKEDEWAHAQRTELNEIQLRVLIQDEDSKYNVLSVLTADEDEAEKAVDRLARVIEWSRKGTEHEIDGTSARRMATAITEYMKRRDDQVLPRPQLLTDREEDEDVGLPLSLREFAAIDPELFPPDVFRDFVDEKGQVVHSLGSFLTVWSSVATLDEANEALQEPGEEEKEEEQEQEQQQEQEQEQEQQQEQQQQEEQQEQQGEENQGQGQDQGDSAPPGWAINVNTAPGAVLHSMIESRDLPYRFWDDVVLFRNEKDDSVEENEDPPLDEYGRPIIVKKFFHSVDDLAQVDGWDGLEPIVQGELKALLKTQSQVFSIFVTARKPTGEEQIDTFSRQADVEREEANWQGLVRTVRAVVWRRVVGEGEVEIVPIVRWEVLDYVPFEVLDFPEARDYR
jgi:type II secretory pathway pseudopilin PulG